MCHTPQWMRYLLLNLSDTCGGERRVEKSLFPLSRKYTDLPVLQAQHFHSPRALRGSGFKDCWPGLCLSLFPTKACCAEKQLVCLYLHSLEGSRSHIFTTGSAAATEAHTKRNTQLTCCSLVLGVKTPPPASPPPPQATGFE